MCGPPRSFAFTHTEKANSVKRAAIHHSQCLRGRGAQQSFSVRCTLLCLLAVLERCCHRCCCCCAPSTGRARGRACRRASLPRWAAARGASARRPVATVRLAFAHCVIGAPLPRKQELQQLQQQDVRTARRWQRAWIPVAHLLPLHAPRQPKRPPPPSRPTVIGKRSMVHATQNRTRPSPKRSGSRSSAIRGSGRHPRSLQTSVARCKIVARALSSFESLATYRAVRWHSSMVARRQSSLSMAWSRPRLSLPCSNARRLPPNWWMRPHESQVRAAQKRERQSTVDQGPVQRPRHEQQARTGIPSGVRSGSRRGESNDTTSTRLLLMLIRSPRGQVCSQSI